MSSNAKCQSCPKSSVNLTKGNLQLEFGTTLPCKGRAGGLPLKLYYSNRDASYIESNFSPMLGPRWSSSFTHRIAGHTESGKDYALIVKAQGGIRKYEYDAMGESFTNPPGAYNTLEWDEIDPDVLVETRNAALNVNYRNDPESQDPFDARVESEVDPNGNALYYQYDENNLLTQLEDPEGRTVYFEHSAQNKIAAITDWAGRTTNLDYDVNGNMDTIVGPENCVNYFHYNDDHRVITAIDPEGYVRYYHYDEHDRVTRDELMGVGATLYTYVIGGPAVTDPNGNVTYYEYTPSAPKPLMMKDPLGNVTYYHYEDGRRTAKIDPKGSVWYFNYDADTGQLVSEIDPLGYTPTTTMTAPSSGPVRSTSSAARRITHTMAAAIASAAPMLWATPRTSRTTPTARC